MAFDLAIHIHREGLKFIRSFRLSVSFLLFIHRSQHPVKMFVIILKDHTIARVVQVSVIILESPPH